jgi:hypothetical protein
MRGHGELVKIGVEGTGSYGAGLARYTAGKGIPPISLLHPHALLEVAAARDACQQAAAALRDAVTCARQAGHPWSTVAAILGVTRQAAQQRFGQEATPERIHDHLT